ncbi:hypothetical protein RI367_007234 [Sorochytrium milnesiophthora]
MSRQQEANWSTSVHAHSLQSGSEALRVIRMHYAGMLTRDLIPNSETQGSTFFYFSMSM